MQRDRPSPSCGNSPLSAEIYDVARRGPPTGQRCAGTRRLRGAHRARATMNAYLGDMPALRASDLKVIEAARDLGPTIDAAADGIERERRLPEPLVTQMRDAGIFQMYVPREVGGPEVHPVTAFHIGETLARHDGSAGWCAQVSAAVSTFAAWIDPAGLTAM